MCEREGVREREREKEIGSLVREGERVREGKREIVCFCTGMLRHIMCNVVAHV